MYSCRFIVDGGVIYVAVHEGRWADPRGVLRAWQPLLRGQLACMSCHGLDHQDEQQRRERAAPEDPRLDWEARCVPSR